MTYDSIIDVLLSDEKIIQYCPEGTTVLPLCIGQTDGYVTDCFLTAVQGDGEEVQIIWKIQAYMPEPENIEVISAESVTETVSCKDSLNPDMELIYMELYPEVRKFAFSPSLSGAEKELLKKFEQAWKGAVEKNIRVKLEKSFPVFFEWVQKLEGM